MRVLFCSRPAHGHVYPLLPLATALRDAGHRVEWGTGEGFREHLEARGFPTHRVGISIPEADRRVLSDHPELLDLPRGERFRIGVAVFGDVLARRTLDDLLPLMDRVTPDLVVYDVGAAVGARAAGVPAVVHSLGRATPEAIRHAVGSRLAEVLAADYGDLPGSAPGGVAYLDICPPSLGDPSVSTPGTRIALRPEAPAEPGARPPEWIAALERPLVYLTLGTYVSGHVASLRAAGTGLGTLEVDVLVAVGPDGDPGALGPLPPSVRVERFVPQGSLMPHLDLVVHHCGSGTMLGALAHGIPQLALPHGADQFTNAEALARSGAGGRLLPEEITAGRVAEAAGAILGDPAHRAAARRLAAEIAAMPAPAEVVPRLERLVG